LVYIGDELRKYRQNKGLSPEEFAEMFFISKNYLDKLESTSLKTRRPLSNKLLIDICKKFNDYSLYDIWDKELERFIREEREINNRKIC
jgi:transcriptional regulator with XRE-family HTH domain